jgi:hypothetical protein
MLDIAVDETSSEIAARSGVGVGVLESDDYYHRVRLAPYAS